MTTCNIKCISNWPHGSLTAELNNFCNKYKIFPHVNYYFHDNWLQHGPGHYKITIPDEYTIILFLEFSNILLCECGKDSQ